MEEHFKGFTFERDLQRQIARENKVLVTKAFSKGMNTGRVSKKRTYKRMTKIIVVHPIGYQGERANLVES